MKERWAFGIILLLLLGGGCVGSQDSGTISGRVLDAHEGSPIASANVSTKPPTSSVTTDADGRYSIQKVPPGNYRVSASKAGYADADIEITVVRGSTTTADIHLLFEGQPETSTTNRLRYVFESPDTLAQLRRLLAELDDEIYAFRLTATAQALESRIRQGRHEPNEQYGELKRNLASQHENERAKYSERKGAFIRAALEKWGAREIL
ncbi:MAG: carboxypeptidase regulatory-like domain-containing protein [Chloroflexia bacterium]|nr:carboxypeptidase regulatory-like domain-containing protein [Chloroflexia bacterium]